MKKLEFKRPLLFLLFANDLKSASDLLEPIMFADDTNLFYSSGDIKNLFAIVNNELKNINGGLSPIS